MRFPARTKSLLILILLLSSIQTYAGEGSINSANGDADFSVSFRFPPTDEQIANTKSAINLMAFGLCDATDGQVRVHRVKLMQGQATEDLADYWVLATPGRSASTGMQTNCHNLGTLGRAVQMTRDDVRAADVWLHEWGHHAFGLGEQYSEQRRFNEACGIGPGFEPGTVTEVNNSIMQQTGSARCVGGRFPAQSCLTDADCPSAPIAGTLAGHCALVLMSEFSVPTNHDPRLGAGGACPAVVPLKNAVFSGSLDRTSPTQLFDPSSFVTAATTGTQLNSGGIEIIDAKGGAPGATLFFYFTHAAAQQWQASAVVDGATVGAAAKVPSVIKQWTLTFSPTGSLKSISEDPPTLNLTGLASGAASLPLTLFFGTANPTNTGGHGFDGIQEGDFSGAILVNTNRTIPLCQDQAKCVSWDPSSQQYEKTSQSELHNNQFDWETLHENYSFLTMPNGLPSPDPPAQCFRTIDYEQDVQGSDQVMLILDRSGSMAWSDKSDKGEICGDGVDNNGDGLIDEAGCGNPRIDFVRQAADAYLDLQQDQQVDVGIMTFNGIPQLDRGIAPLDAGTLSDFKLAVDAIKPGGATGIGDGSHGSRSRICARRQRRSLAYGIFDDRRRQHFRHRRA